MPKTPHTAEEVHFLVRLGQWSIERLEQWVQERIEDSRTFDEEDWQEVKEDWTEWDDKYD